MAEVLSNLPPPGRNDGDLARLEQLAKDCERTGDAAGSIEAWRRVLAVEPDRRAAHRRLADLLYENDAAIAAIPHLRAVAEAEPIKAKFSQRLDRLSFGDRA